GSSTRGRPGAITWSSGSDRNVRNPLANGRRVWKHAGFAYAAVWLVDRILYRVGIHTFIVSTHERDWVMELPEPHVAPYTFRWATPEEVLAAAADSEPEWMDATRGAGAR